MDAVVSLEDVANIVSFVAPGYFAIQMYSLVYAKRDREFARLLVESVVFSVPIVALANVVWQLVANTPASSLSPNYALLLVGMALFAGYAATVLRKRRPISAVAEHLGLGSPSEDFIKVQLERIDANDPKNNTVTVALKSGSIFSGTAEQISRYSREGPVHYYFSHLAWYNPATSRWQEQQGGIIVERAEIEYIVTPKLVSEDLVQNLGSKSAGRSVNADRQPK